MKHIRDDFYYYGRWEDDLASGTGFMYQPFLKFVVGEFRRGVLQGDIAMSDLAKGTEFKGTVENGYICGMGRT